jgi:acyl carrier protein
MDQKIISIMSNVFGVEESAINEHSSPENIEQWDSLKHMQLILAIEEEFDIEIPDDLAVEMLDFVSVKNTVSSLLNSNN